ncbi:MAG: hypothetical protein R3D56_00070 [Paracoccaceae bacterium]
MEFRIADTFTDSLGRLTAQEQKAAKTTAFDLQLDPTSNGLSFHKLDRAKDANFWSVRVNADIRIIVHRTAASILLVCRSPRRRLQMGGATQDRTPPDHRRHAADRGARTRRRGRDIQAEGRGRPGTFTPNLPFACSIICASSN